MPKRFCVTGTCIPEKNYMVDISGRIDRIIRDYIEMLKIERRKSIWQRV